MKCSRKTTLSPSNDTGVISPEGARHSTPAGMRRVCFNQAISRSVMYDPSHVPREEACYSSISPSLCAAAEEVASAVVVASAAATYSVGRLNGGATEENLTGSVVRRCS